MKKKCYKLNDNHSAKTFPAAHLTMHADGDHSNADKDNRGRSSRNGNETPSALAMKIRSIEKTCSCYKVDLVYDGQDVGPHVSASCLKTGHPSNGNICPHDVPRPPTEDAHITKLESQQNEHTDSVPVWDIKSDKQSNASSLTITQSAKACPHRKQLEHNSEGSFPVVRLRTLPFLEVSSQHDHGDTDSFIHMDTCSKLVNTCNGQSHAVMNVKVDKDARRLSSSSLAPSSFKLSKGAIGDRTENHPKTNTVSVSHRFLYTAHWHTGALKCLVIKKRYTASPLFWKLIFNFLIILFQLDTNPIKLANEIRTLSPAARWLRIKDITAHLKRRIDLLALREFSSQVRPQTSDEEKVSVHEVRFGKGHNIENGEKIRQGETDINTKSRENSFLLSSCSHLVFIPLKVNVIRPRLEEKIVWPLLCNENQHCNRYCVYRGSDNDDRSLVYSNDH